MTRTELRLGVALAACALLLVCFTVQQQPTALLEDFADYPSAFSKLVKNHHRGTAFGHGAPPRSGSSSSAWLPPSSSRYSAPEDVLYLKHSSAWYRRLAAEKTKIMQERQDQRDTAERNSKVGWERIAALKSKSASSMADEEYYQDKRHLAKSQLDFSRSRAQATESDVLAAKLAAFTAQQAAESAHEKEVYKCFYAPNQHHTYTRIENKRIHMHALPLGERHRQ